MILDPFRMGKAVGNIFSTTLLVHLIGATSLLCILGYQILTVSLYYNNHTDIIFTYLKGALNARF